MDETQNFAKQITHIFESAEWSVAEEEGPQQETKNGIVVYSYHYHVDCCQAAVIKQAFSKANVTIDQEIDYGDPAQDETASLLVADKP